MLTLTYNSTDIYKTQINYEAGDGTTSTKSYRISSLVNDYGSASPETLSYTYDERGYITQVYEDSTNYSQYRYDDFGQLIRENYKWGGTSYTKIFNYDVGGNITSVVAYAFVAGDGTVGTATDTVSYGYTDSTWKDKLTSFDGDTITYDNIGNPLSDGTWTYTWGQGRKLTGITDGSTTASYKYNSDGIRTEKTVGGTTTVYNVVGGKVTWEKTGSSNPMYYLYDSSGKLWALEYNNNTYLYVRNAQGDITKLINNSGDVVVEYTYDAWGNLMSTTGSMASTLGVDNPYRYRGYRYDTETGLYYLQSRYYNPQWGRFANADAAAALSIEQNSLNQSNLFAYCLNNPVMRSDDGGYLSNWLKIGIGVLAVAGALAITVATGGAAAPILIGVAVSTVSGAAIGGAVGYSQGGAQGLKKGLIDGACDGFMWGGVGAFGGASISAGVKAVRAANQGVTIGKGMSRVITASKDLNTSVYKPLNPKVYNYIASKNVSLADNISVAHNKIWIQSMKMLRANIYDIGLGTSSDAGRWYGMELEAVKDYVKHFIVSGY